MKKGKINIIIITFVFSIYTSWAQNDSAVDCAFLEATFQTKEVLEHFNLCKYPDKILTIIDTNFYFTNCRTVDICNRKAEFIRSWSDNFDVNMGSSREHIYTIVVYKLLVKKKFVYIYLWQPYTNGNLVIRLKRRRNSIKTKILVTGVF
jgi:hypothetical protein